jgi:hypothetical protein
MDPGIPADIEKRGLVLEDLECDDGGTASGMQFRGTKRSYLDASQGWI